MQFERQMAFPPIRAATKVIMGITLAMFVLQFFLQGAGGRTFMSFFELSWGMLSKGCIWQPITYLFIHNGAMHLFWNVLFLFFFASMVEEVFGRKRFLLFYLACGAIASVAWMALTLVSGDIHSHVLVGGSGAIYGVLCAAGAMYPSQTVYLFFVLRVPIRYLVFTLMFLQFALTFDAHAAGNGVANSAHFFGGLAGYLYGLRFRQAARLGLPVDDTWWTGNIFANWKASHRRGRFQVMPGGSDAEPSSEDVDRILEKVHASGFESLSKKEQAILERASGKK